MAAWQGILLEDIGISDVITVRAGIDISGGMLIAPTSGAWSNAVHSTGTRAVFDENAVTVANVSPSGTVVPMGMALQDKASGTSNYVGVHRKGTMIFPVNGDITEAAYVAAGAAAAASSASLGPAGAAVQSQIGIAYGAAASGGYVIVSLNI